MRTLFVRILLLAFALSSPALADGGTEEPATSAARAAYAEGAGAYERGDFEVAARAFDRADLAVPNATALRYALKAATRANDAVLAMALAVRARRDPRDAELTEAAGLAATTFESRVGEIELDCPPAVVCSATIDGAAVPVGRRTFLLVGEHRLGLRVGPEEGAPRTIRIEPGQVTRLEITAGAEGRARTETRQETPGAATGSAADRQTPARRAATAPRSGLAPAWFWAGAGTTAVLAAVTIASGLDALAKNRDFQRSGDGSVRSDGVAAQTRTNVLLAITSGAAIATAAIGLWGVRWSASASAGPTPNGASLALVARGAF